jgi:hypothetical protein
MKMIETLKTPKQVAHQYQICGLHLTSNVPFQLPKAHPHKHQGSDIKFTLRPPGTMPGKVPHRGTHIGDIKNGAGQPTITVYKIDHGFHLDCNNGSTRILFAMARDGNWIECYPQAETLQENIETWLLGLVLSFLLQGRGIFSLHGAAVECRKRAIVFSGNNGYGKTTLASYFLQKGHSLITDDVLPIVEKEGVSFALPVCPFLNLWPQTLAQFGNLNGNMLDEKTKTGKHRYSLETLKVQFCKSAMPIGSIYFLNPTDKEAIDKAQISPIPQARALVALLGYTRANSMIELSNQKNLLKTYTNLVSRVPVYHLEYPVGFEFLPDVYAAVLQDILCK